MAPNSPPRRPQSAVLQEPIPVPLWAKLVHRKHGTENTFTENNIKQNHSVKVFKVQVLSGNRNNMEELKIGAAMPDEKSALRMCIRKVEVDKLLGISLPVVMIWM